MTTVSQEAREAAAALIDKHGRSKDWTPTNIRLGNLDDLPTVQAFAKFERDTLARHRLERSEPVGWMGIESAPVNTPVRIKAGNMIFLARLVPGASMSDLDTACDQWQAEIEGEHPPCWSGGACWDSNEDEATSLQPTAWCYPPDTTPPEPVAEIERLREALEPAFVTSVTEGNLNADKVRYKLVFEFRSLAELDDAHTAWIYRKGKNPCAA